VTKSSDIFAAVEKVEADPIFAVVYAYQNDPRPEKINLSIGMYVDEHGRLPVLKSVTRAEHLLAEENSQKGYLGQVGLPAFNKQIPELLLGPNSKAAAEGRVRSIQTVAGTGALRVGADFLNRLLPDAEVWVSRPTWVNHRPVLESAGFKTVNSYGYFNRETGRLDTLRFIEDLKKIPERSVVLLHACCHNPTGVDPTHDEWAAVIDVLAERGLVPFVDFAYQGLGEGLDEDAWAVREMERAGLTFLVATSFSKSFSLYSERAGALTIIGSDKDEVDRVISQWERLVRSNYSNPPAHGAKIINKILSDPTLRSSWKEELDFMRNRMRQLRQDFVKGLVTHRASGDFAFLKEQKGMFSFTCLSDEAVERLRNEYAIYAVKGGGRICVAALNSDNIDRVCSAVAEVSQAS
jgi:aromatic-amino-acid transaminase